MSWLNRQVSTQAVAPPPVVEPPPDVSKVPVGEKIGNLTCMGTSWWNLDEVVRYNPSPADGCGMEITVKGGQVFHLNQYGKACWLKYLDQERARLTKVDSEVKELERIAERLTPFSLVMPNVAFALSGIGLRQGAS